MWNRDWSNPLTVPFLEVYSFNTMKYLICSDIHGSAEACKKILELFVQMKCDKIILLGDILYHGPRNPLPEGHNPKLVTDLLNPLSDNIFACRGNCDAEVDQWVLNFNMMGDYVQIIDENVSLFCTHGHVYAPILSDGNFPVGCNTATKHPNLKSPAVIFYGHTHIPVLEMNKNGVIICNPGSISLPKENSEPGFAIYEKKKVSLFNLKGGEIDSISF